MLCMFKVDGISFTDLERALVTNGCGASKGFKPMEAEFFDCPCDKHDIRYSRGGWEWHRLLADVSLFKDQILRSWKFSKWFAMPWHMLIATIYLVALVLFGWYNFSYSIRRVSKAVILERARIRNNGGNPCASINECLKYLLRKR